MNTKIQFLVLAVIVVLAVAVLGLYLTPAPVPEGLGQGVNSETGGSPTGFTEISFNGGETERFGLRELKMDGGTTTMTYDNRSGDDLLIYDPAFVIPSSARSAATYVWVLSTSTLTSAFTSPSVTPIALTGTNVLMVWQTATGSQATSTSLNSLGIAGKGIAVGNNGTSGFDASANPILLKNNERLVLTLISNANVFGDGEQAGSGTSPAAASSTARGFDPILKFIYQSVD